MLMRHKRWLLALFQQVQELRANPLEKRMLALHIQESLLHRIGRAEYLIRKIRDDNKSIKRALTRPDTSRIAARKAKARHLAGSDRIEHQKALIAVLRSIGDSIAFIYGNRWDLKQMVLKEDSGFITGKNGTRLERGILRKAFEMGATVIMNDLTHTLRHGDITVFRPDLWPEGESPFLLIEVKSGRGGDRTRTSRQIAATEQIFSYLETDKREANGGLWQRVSVNEHPKYHFEEVTRMMTDLPKGGWLLEQVEPGLHYALIDCAREKAYDRIFGDLFSRGRAFLMSVNDMKKHQLAYYPFPLCIHNPETLFRFYNGDFVMFVIVDLNRVNEAMAKYSMKVALSGSDEFPWTVSSTARDAVPESSDFYLGFHPIGRLAAEFLRLDWLLENMVAGPVTEAIDKYLRPVLPEGA
jgi:hypothetical protein